IEELYVKHRRKGWLSKPHSYVIKRISSPFTPIQTLCTEHRSRSSRKNVCSYSDPTQIQTGDCRWSFARRITSGICLYQFQNQQTSSLQTKSSKATEVFGFYKSRLFRSAQLRRLHPTRND